MARPGEKIVTHTELEARLRMLESKINGVLSFLFFIGGSEKKNFMVQGGIDLFAGAGTAKTFGLPFKVGSSPLVLMTSRHKDMVAVMDALPTATAFTGYGRYISDGSVADCNAFWLAIGERG
ncbi:MAG: hypothetical protein WC374_13250 [Phycisphaerae bacterium]|jgi:hypothetical protein